MLELVLIPEHLSLFFLSAQESLIDCYKPTEVSMFSVSVIHAHIVNISDPDIVDAHMHYL